MKEFTNDEKIIAKNIDKNYKWIARDRDGNLCAYEERPKKEGDNWFSDGYEYIYKISSGKAHGFNRGMIASPYN